MWLKQSLPEDKRVSLFMTERLGQEEGQYGPQFKYKFSWNSQSFDHSATMTEEKKLQNVEVGTELQVVKEKNPRGAGFMLIWGLPDGKSLLVTRPVTQEPREEQPQKEEQKFVNPEPPAKPDWDKIALSKIVHNFMLEGYELGKSRPEITNDAKWLTVDQFALVDELAVELQKKSEETPFGEDPTDEYGNTSYIDTLQ